MWVLHSLSLSAVQLRHVCHLSWRIHSGEVSACHVCLFSCICCLRYHQLEHSRDVKSTAFIHCLVLVVLSFAALSLSECCSLSDSVVLLSLHRFPCLRCELAPHTW